MWGSVGERGGAWGSVGMRVEAWGSLGEPGMRVEAWGSLVPHQQQQTNRLATRVLPRLTDGIKCRGSVGVFGKDVLGTGASSRGESYFSSNGMFCRGITWILTFFF